MTDAPTPYQRTLAFHQATKHHPDRYARSPGYMDWANQPNPFRSWADCETMALPFIEKDPPGGHLELYTRSSGKPAPLALATVAGFLELSLGLSAWKAAGDSRWALRINPSSGNLHPTEGYLILPAMEGIEAGIYHYDPLNHRLERRARMPESIGTTIAGHFKTGGFMVALTSIFWRESWKYGERAFRYCQHDVGHALAALGFSAALQGWQLTVLGDLADSALASLLGLDQTDWPRLEAEHPDLAAWVHPAADRVQVKNLPGELVAALGNLAFTGRPNRLSPTPVDWEIIKDVADATAKPPTQTPVPDLPVSNPVRTPSSALTGAGIIRQRRSASAFDPDGSMDVSVLEAILDKTLARSGCAPFNAGIGPPSIDLVLFVHRVNGLTPGLYALDRGTSTAAPLKTTMKSEFAWEAASSRLPFYLLEPGDLRHTAIELSCHQPIAGFGIFSLAMMARFERCIKEAPYRYRHLFWEAGMIGQILYLEAEAHGFRGTGIGCYFDDAVHDLLGIDTLAWQSLYHFTVGVAKEDLRLTTYPPYHHLERE
ncbi:MAG: SagB/ThcOx family dehydrogenase [Desulfobacterales bacterium]|nr:SagB/ThcOx family dehydrogenase [Desulfobacterales bacterium]